MYGVAGIISNMSTTTLTQTEVSIPPLENGDHLSATEFLRRYEAMPHVKKAELIQGVVHMASPVPARDHGRKDNLIQGWLGNYAEATPGVEAYSNSTAKFGPDDVPQPDIMLCLPTERGGQSRLNANGYIVGAPELAVEITASTASYDMREKLETYRRFGVLEYVIWLTEKREIQWLRLDDDEYQPMQADHEGILKSHAFPGLWMDVNAMLAYNRTNARLALERGLKSAEHAAFIK